MIRAVIVILTLSIILAIATFAWARAPICLPEKGLHALMWKDYRERPVLTAKMTGADKWLTIYASPKHKTMTVWRAGKDGIACIIFAATDVSFLYPV